MARKIIIIALFVGLIFAVVVGLLSPGGSIMFHMHKTERSHRLKVLSIAICEHEAEHGFLPRSTHNNEGLLGWRLQLLTNCEIEVLYFYL